jgi:outer membrane receptor protein involved in Fe transport
MRRGSILLSTVACATICVAGPVRAAPMDAPISFDIPAQSLDTAVLAYSQQTGLQVVSSGPLLAHKATTGVQGMYTPREALRELLRQSDLSFVVPNQQTITIVPRPIENAQPITRIALASQDVAPAAAQAPTQVAQAAPQSNALEEVVVTASRTSSTVNKIAMAVSAVTQKSIEAKGIKTVDDLARTVPGMTFRKTGADNNPVITIRGIGGNGATVGSQTTGVYLDDSALQRRQINGLQTGNGSPFPQLFDLDRVEVLRGPQGTLYGGSSEGGTVRFITPTPSLTTYSGQARAEVSTTDNGSPSYEGAIAGGGPIVEDKLGFRGSVIDRHNGGWIDALSIYDGHRFGTDVNYGDSAAFRGTLRWAVTPTFTVTPAVYVGRDYSNQGDTFWGPSAQVSYPGSVIHNGANGCTKTTAAAASAGPCQTSSGVWYAFPDTTMPAFVQNAMPWYTGYSMGNGRYLTPTNVQYVASPRATNLFLPSLTLDQDFGFFSVKSITSYVKDNTKGVTFGGGGGSGRVLSRYVYGPTTCDPSHLTNLPRVGGLCYTPPSYQPGFPDSEDYYHYASKRDATSEELRFSSRPGERLSWVGGLFFSDSNIHMHGLEDSNEDTASELFHGTPEGWQAGNYGLPADGKLTNSLSPPAQFADVSDREVWLHEREYAVFGEANFNVTEKLKLTAGVRLDDYTQNFRQIYGGLVAGNPPAGTSETNPAGFVVNPALAQAQSANPALPNSRTNPIVNPAALSPFAVNLAGCPSAYDCPEQFTNLQDHERTVAPKFGVSYNFTPTNMAYFTYSKGFRPGGVNPPVPPITCAVDFAALGITSTPKTYNQDTVSSYEVGNKARLFDGRMQVNTSVFYIDWANMQFNETLSCGFGIIQNAADVVSKGAEVQATGRIGPVTLDANVGYDDAAYAKAVKNSAGTVIQNKGDNVGVPDWTVSLDGQYDFRALDNPGYFRLDYTYTGKYMRSSGPGTTAFNALTTNGQTTQIWNARLGYTFRKVDWSLFVQNLTNSQTFISESGGATVTSDSGRVNGTSFRPRTIGVQANYRF